MADTNDFFSNWLPNKLKTHPDLVKSINAVYQFDIDGAGQWTADLTGEGTVAVGPHPSPGCVVSATKADWENMIENPTSAMMLFMAGKLKVSNVALGISLQKILS
ncbi:MAG: SCP2 sterol-binding domain-containing protein [Myxococcota bacterium]